MGGGGGGGGISKLLQKNPVVNINKLGELEKPKQIFRHKLWPLTVLSLYQL